MSALGTVPQTTLERVRSAVDAIGNHSRAPAQIARAMGASARHAAYAVAAARVLGLIVNDSEEQRLTDLGRSLHETILDSEGERRVLLEALSKSSFMRRIAPGLMGQQQPSLSAISKNIQRETGLAAGTASHRAAMIVKWRRKLLDPQIRIFNEKRSGMWRRLEIRNFRSIEVADVDLAPFTVVVGPNGSGKSNFADAVVFARDVAFDAAAAISNRGGIVGVRRWRPTKPTDVAIDVRAASSRPALDRSYVRQFLKIHSGKSGNWSFSQETIEIFSNGERTSYVERGADTVKSNVGDLSTPSETASAMVLVRQLRPFKTTSALRNVRRYRLNPEGMRHPQLASGESRLEETGANIAVAIDSMTRLKKMTSVLEPMAKIVPGLQDIYVEQVGRFLALKFRQKQAEGAVAEFNATEISEGALRALGIIVATSQMVRDELLIVEEPEVSIHAGAAQLLFDILKEASERGAVLVTTHSADLLDAAKNEEILVCEYNDGTTRIGPLADAQRKVVRKGLFSIAELMRSEPLRIEARTQAKRNGR